VFLKKFQIGEVGGLGLGNHPKEGLAKFGYRLGRKVKSLGILLCVGKKIIIGSKPSMQCNLSV
jgi:hypothetical protein